MSNYKHVKEIIVNKEDLSVDDYLRLIQLLLDCMKQTNKENQDIDETFCLDFFYSFKYVNGRVLRLRWGKNEVD